MASANLKEAYKQIEKLLPTGQRNDPYLTGAQSHFERVMNPNYKAYSDSDLQHMYDTQASRYGQAFKQQDNQMAARLANQGLSGSGAGFGYWSDQSKGQKQQLTDMWNNLQSMNIEASRGDKNTAFGMAPSLSSARLGSEAYPLNAWTQWAGILGQDESRQLQERMFQQQLEEFKYGKKKDTMGGWGKALGTAAGWIFGGGPVGGTVGGTLGGLIDGIF